MTEETKNESVAYPDVRVRLTGLDGNAFVLIGAVSGALRKAGHKDAASVFGKSAMACGSYDELLRLCTRTVTVR